MKGEDSGEGGGGGGVERVFVCLLGFFFHLSCLFRSHAHCCISI